MALCLSLILSTSLNPSEHSEGRPGRDEGPPKAEGPHHKKSRLPQKLFGEQHSFTLSSHLLAYDAFLATKAPQKETLKDR